MKLKSIKLLFTQTLSLILVCIRRLCLGGKRIQYNPQCNVCLTKRQENNCPLSSYQVLEYDDDDDHKQCQSNATHSISREKVWPPPIMPISNVGQDDFCVCRAQSNAIYW